MNPIDHVNKFAEHLSHDDPDGTKMAFLQKVGRPLIYIASAFWLFSFVFLNVQAGRGVEITWPPAHVTGALVAVIVDGVLGRQWGKNKEVEVKSQALEDDFEYVSEGTSTNPLITQETTYDR